MPRDLSASDVGVRRNDGRTRKTRAGGGAQGFLVPLADGARRGEDGGGAEGFGGTNEGAEVAGVLQALRR